MKSLVLTQILPYDILHLSLRIFFFFFPYLGFALQKDILVLMKLKD